ncbi:MAG: PPC domain-containing protein [Myxococcales bacterium]|nr:PPC domain-containing protein [Myxococcales bacterium]
MAAAVGSSTTVGCGSDASTGGAGGGSEGGNTSEGGSTGPTMPTGGGGMGTGGTGGGGGGNDESTSCADAPLMTTAQNNLGGDVYVGEGAIQTAGDRDFWKFEAEAGEWLQVITIANENDDSTFIDTVIRLRDEDGNTVLATDDDAFPRVDTDSELFYRVPAAGTYCLEVLEFGDWTGAPVAKPNQNYSAQVIPVDFGLYETFNEDTEPNNTSMTANTGLSSADLTNGQIFTTVAGTFADNADSDWYEISFPAGSIGFNLDLTPSGAGADGNNATSGFGSTSDAGAVALWTSDSTPALVAEVDGTLQSQGLDGFSSVPIDSGGTYFLQVTHPGGTAGANDFYFMKFFSSDTLNPQETNEGGNNNSVANGGVPETPAAGTPDANGVVATFIGGVLSEGDVDYWQLQGASSPTAGEKLSVACSSWASGSGVRGMTVTYEDSTSTTPMVTSTEDAAKGVLWADNIPDAVQPAITIQSAGPHYIRLANLPGAMPSDPNTDTAALAKHYLCGIRRQP